jgi:muramidase (phage lysozyme)
MAFGNLTVDFRQLSKIPVRDRVTLAKSPQASSIFGNLSPTEIAALFPDYYKKFIPSGSGGGASMASGMTGAGYTGGGTAPSTGGGTSGTGGATPAPTGPVVSSLLQDLYDAAGPQQTSGPVPKDTGMFNTIRKAEGTTDEQAQKNGFANGYDVVLGYGKYGRPPKPLTQMSFREVYEFQRNVLLKNHGSSTAAGAFQIVSINIFDRKTGDVTEFMKKAGLSMNDTMTPENQRKLAYQIYKKQGLGAWQGLTLNPQLMSIAQEQAKNLDIESDISNVSSDSLPGTEPIDQAVPADETGIIPLEQGGTATVSPQSTAFDPAIFEKIDPRYKELYNTATEEEKRKIEWAITKNGVDKLNEIAQKHPRATAEVL